MGNDKSKSKLRELILVFLLTLATGYFGVNRFPILMLVLPSFSVVIGVKYGIKYNLINMGLVSTVLSFVSGIIYLPIFLIYSGLAFALNLGIVRKEKISRVVSRGGAWIFFMTALASIVLKLYFEINLAEEIREIMNIGLESTIKDLEAMGGEYDIALFKSAMQETITYTRVLFPAILAMGSLFISSFSYGIASYIIRKNKIREIPPMRLKDFKLSSKFSAASIIIVIAVLVTKYMGLSIYEVLVSNLTFILYTLIFIQGIGVISYLLDKTRLNKAFKWIILVFFILNISASFIVSIVGVIDIVFNFRKIRE